MVCLEVQGNPEQTRRCRAVTFCSGVRYLRDSIPETTSRLRVV